MTIIIRGERGLERRYTSMVEAIGEMHELFLRPSVWVKAAAGEPGWVQVVRHGLPVRRPVVVDSIPEEEQDVDL